MILTDLPDDILIAILYQTDLAALVSLSAVCTRLRTTALLRTVWITVLNAHRRTHPIACPSHAQLTIYSLPALIAIAHTTLRLQHNWARPLPPIHGQVTTIHFPTKLDIIFRIPGTHLCLMHNPIEGTMCCWDVAEAREVSNTIFVAREILEASLGRDEPGQYSRAILASVETVSQPLNELALIIVTATYDTNDVRLSVSFHQPCTHPHLHYFGIFLYRDILGVLRSDIQAEDAVLEIVAFNTTSRACSIITTDIPTERTIMYFESQLEIVFTRTNMLLLFEQSHQKQFYRCPLPLLPFHATESTTRTLNCISKPGYSWTEEYHHALEMTYLPEGILASDPAYGILAASVVSINDPDGPGILVKFWSLDSEMDIEDERRETAKDKDNPTNPKAYFPIIETILLIPGELQQWSDWLPFKLAHSGKDIVLVVTHNKETYLQLVRFDPDTRGTTVHRLGLPCPVEAKFVEGISLDEHLGVVTLVDLLKTIYAIPFA